MILLIFLFNSSVAFEDQDGKSVGVSQAILHFENVQKRSADENTTSAVSRSAHENECVTASWYVKHVISTRDVHTESNV